MENENARMAAMKAKFEEEIAKLREDLTSRLRVDEAARQGPGVSTSANDSLIRLHYSTRSPPKMPHGGQIQQQRSSGPWRQQQFRPQQRPPHNPPPGHPTWGPGGKLDCRSNATYFQKESPPPAGAPMGAVHVCPRSADPPAIVAAMMRPGPQRRMNCDDLHFSLGHTNADNARETAKQRGIKVTGVRGYCDGCGQSKTIRRALPKETTLKAERPMKRVFVDLTGPYLTSAGGTRYCMLMVDDYTNVGWTLFLGNTSGDTLCQAFRSWHTAVKSTAAIHRGLEIARFDNGNEFTNADFRKLLTELRVAVEYTPVDGAKRNGRVERKLGLIAEGARAAWLEFPRHFSDLEFPAKANSWHQVWPEAFTWMNDCLNTTAQAHTPDKLSLYERLYKKRPTNRLLPLMMPGFRPHNRKNKAESKGERCFFLNCGNNHSSTTDKILLPSGIASYSADVTCG